MIGILHSRFAQLRKLHAVQRVGAEKQDSTLEPKIPCTNVAMPDAPTTPKRMSHGATGPK